MESESRDFRMESESEWNQEIFPGILLESESEMESGFLMKSGIGIKHFWNRASLALTIFHKNYFLGLIHQWAL